MAQSDIAPHPNLELVLRYLRAIEENADAERLAAFFDPEVRQHEFPNRLVDGGAERDLVTLLEGSRKGRQVIENQRYSISNAMASDDRVALEVEWTGQLKVALANTPIGGTLRARCGMFFRIHNGRIVEQHNYDCFDRF